MRAWSAALGWIADTRCAPRNRSGASATSPAAKMPGTLVPCVVIHQHALGHMHRRLVEEADVSATPAATITRSQSRRSPVDRLTTSGASEPASLPRSMRCTPAEVSTRMPFSLDPALDHAARLRRHHAWHHAVAHLHHGELHAALGVSASMMMQPMKPAPSCSTRAPGLACAAIARVGEPSSRCTEGRSTPGWAAHRMRAGGDQAGGRSARSDRRRTAPCACRRRARHRAAAQLADAQALEVAGSLRSQVPDSSMLPSSR